MTNTQEDSKSDEGHSQESVHRGQAEDESKVVACSALQDNSINTCEGQLPATKFHANGGGAPSTISQSEVAAMAKRNAKHHKKWNRRLKIFFCCLGYKKNKESIADVASIFAEFYSDLNAPPSDIAAGFVLLSKYQAAQRQWMLRHSGQQQGLAVDQFLSGIPINQNTKFLDISTAEDSHLMNDLIYYMNYSLAIFGWPLQMIDDPCMLCCIYPYLSLSPCCTASGGGKKRKSGPGKSSLGEADEKTKKREKCKNKEQDDDRSGNGREQDVEEIETSEARQPSGTANAQAAQQSDAHSASSRTRIPGHLDENCDLPIILEDNCCSCNAASAERRLAQHNYEIIYISYKSSINVVPFLVAADHSKQTVVVAIRGSMNLADMVTDLNGTVDKVPIKDCPDDWLCHRGITSAAVYVKSTLLEKRILERSFSCRPDIGSQDYGLVICGHSLGAGAAAILGVLLREQYPSLRAYLYSPPGGILSMPVVEYTKQFAVGIILGNDTVARLGVAQLERLRYHSLLSLKSAHRSPGRILARALCPSICCGSNEVEYDPEQSLDLLHGTGGRAFDYNNTKIPFQVQPQVLYVPGRLIHVVKNYSFRSKTQRFWSGPIYQAVWTDNATYDRIMISEGMFLDHLPNNLMHAMKMLFSRTLPGRRDSKLSSSVVQESPSRVPEVPTVVEVSLEQKIECTERIDLKKKSADEGPLAQAKNVIEDFNNNNNSSEDLNNNNDAKLFPNQNRGHNRHADIKSSSLNGSVASNLSGSQKP